MNPDMLGTADGPVLSSDSFDDTDSEGLGKGTEEEDKPAPEEGQEIISRNSSHIVVFLETDIVGNPIGSERVEETISAELSAAGYTIMDIDIQAEDFLPGNVGEFYTFIREEYDAQRIIYGTAGIVEVNESNGFNINVRGSLRVYDVFRDRIVLVINENANSQAADSARAVYSAFMNLGRNLAKRLMENTL
ncbi:MAG: hypothetical protein ACR2PY_02100 [Salinispira sp.]